MTTKAQKVVAAVAALVVLGPVAVALATEPARTFEELSGVPLGVAAPAAAMVAALALVRYAAIRAARWAWRHPKRNEVARRLAVRAGLLTVAMLLLWELCGALLRFEAVARTVEALMVAVPVAAAEISVGKALVAGVLVLIWVAARSPSYPRRR